MNKGKVALNMMPRLLPKMLLGMGVLLLAACQTMADHGGWTRARRWPRSALAASSRRHGAGSSACRTGSLFATDASDIRPEQIQVIGGIAGKLVAVGIRRAQVEGHADDTGTARHNDALSVRRASAVADAMARWRHAARQHFRPGAGRPVSDREQRNRRQGRQENRRVVILITAP